MKVFVSWSGGKDSCLALYKASKSGFKVEFLFNMLSEDGLRSRGHGLRKDVIDAQAKAIGIPIIYGKATWETYEDEFKRIINDLKSKGIEGGIFGDIDLQEHRDWVESVCEETNLKAFEPLWRQQYETLLSEFIDGGFEAVVVSAKSDLIDSDWVGHPLDWEFIDYLRSRDIDLCGENGEYHTLVICGPFFQQRIEIIKSKKVMKADRWLFEILEFDVI